MSIFNNTCDIKNNKKKYITNCILCNKNISISDNLSHNCKIRNLSNIINIRAYSEKLSQTVGINGR